MAAAKTKLAERSPGAAAACYVARMPTDQDELLRHRATIDRTDRELIALLGERFAAARQIGAVKAKLGEVVVRPERERALRAQHARWAQEQDVPPALVRAIYDVILAHSRAIQERPDAPSDSQAKASETP